MNIYLDNCAFNRPFDNQNQLSISLETQAKLYIQQIILEEKINLVWSYILDYENSLNPYYERRETIARWKKFSIMDLDESSDVLNKANKLTETGLKGKDALHVACAVKGNCNYFITTDKQIIKTLRNKNDIMCINPIEFVEIIEQYGY